MKITTYKNVCKNEGLDFVEIVNKERNLKINEYYAIMVVDYGKDHENNPNVIGVDLVTQNYLIGLEKPTLGKSVYLSKDFNKRHAIHRGYTVVVKTKAPENYTIL